MSGMVEMLSGAVFPRRYVGGGYVFHQKTLAEVMLTEAEEAAVKDLICSGTCSCAGMTPPWW